MSDENKTHFRKAFKSCYLAAVDITEEIELTISRVTEEMDASVNGHLKVHHYGHLKVHHFKSGF